MSTRSALDSHDVRASDEERHDHAELLGEHAAHGRLSVDELTERLDRVYAARTRGELAQIVADLPPQPPPRPAREETPARREFRGHLASFVAVNLLLIAIWALTGAGYFWPIWPILGWGIGIASHASDAFGGPRLGIGACGGRHRARRHLA